MQLLPLLRRRKVTEPGDTDFLPGQVVDRFEFEDENHRIREAGGEDRLGDRRAHREW